MATHEVYNVLRGKISDALDGARSAGASLAKSAHEILDVAHAEPTATAAGTTGRAALIDRETVRVLLTGANLSRIDGMLSAYGAVLKMLEDEHEAARERFDTEGARDAETWREARAEDPETDDADRWMVGAWNALVENEGPSAYLPLSEDEAKARYFAAFLAALKGAS